MKKLVVLGVVVLLALLPVRIGGLNQPFPVYGYIKDSHGNAVVNALVYITDISKSTYITTYTNSYGYYQANLYNLKNCENGDEIEISCSYGSESNSVTFILNVAETSKNVSFSLVAPPSVNDMGVSYITANSAKINGAVTELGDTYCNVWVEYGKTASYGHTTSKKTLYSPAQFSFSISNLEPDTTYHYRIVAQNSVKTSYTGDATFTTNASMPVVATLSATGVEYSKATLRGYLSSVGAKNCEVWFVWDTLSHASWQDYAHATSHIYLSSPSSFSALIEGLSVNTTYHFRAVAMNKAGIAVGDDITFQTHIVLPTVKTKPASNITATSACLNGELLDGGGGACQVWFEYGLTASYGHSTLPMNASAGFFAVIENLQPGKTYHFRAVAKNYAGISYGSDMTFKTAAVKANVSTDSIEYAVILNGKLNDMGGSSYCYVWFEYGLNTSYGNSTSKIKMTSTGKFSAVLTGLEENKTYHYRAVVQNDKGITYGQDMTFRTLSLPSPPNVLTMNASVDKLNRTATLYANISMNGNSYCYVWFEYWNGVHKTTGVKIITNDSIISETIKLANGNYSYRAIAVGSNGRIAYGNILNFSMIAGDREPYIKAVSPANNSIVGRNVSLMVKASDADGDMLNITFFWGNGTIIGNVSGYNGTFSIALYDLMPSTYSWYAVASDGILQNVSETMYFSVSSQLKADFYFEPYPVVENETVYFYDNSSGASSWLWQFGDGATSNESSPSHIFAHGIYTINLTVCGAGGGVASIEKQIHVYMAGDANMDDVLDARDVTKLEIMIRDGIYSRVADINHDGKLDGQDIKMLIHRIIR